MSRIFVLIFFFVACHNGVNVGSNSYQKLGLVKDYLSVRGNVTESDYGRFNVTGNEQDKFLFKVPTLRNVALTAPYFHDGQINNLNDAVAIMATYQLGRDLTQEQINDIVAFLGTLTAPNLPTSKYEK